MRMESPDEESTEGTEPAREVYEPGWYRVTRPEPPSPRASGKRRRFGRRRRRKDAQPAAKDAQVSVPTPRTTAPATDAASGSAGTPSIRSLAAAERMAALEELAAHGLSEQDVATVGTLVSDPERDIRALAVQTLTARADVVPGDVSRRALQDPTDEVRSAAVRLEAARSDPDLTTLGPLVAARRWPLTQQVALEVLPGLIEGRGVSDPSLDTILLAVAGMGSSPLREERSGFMGVVRAVGRERLIGALELPDDRRLGAARLLLEEGSIESLRAVADHAGDPLDEMRIAAGAARGRVAAAEPAAEPAPVARSAPEPRPEGEAAPAAEVHEVAAPGTQKGRGDIISGLAAALEDPDEGVRERAVKALAGVERPSLVSWATAALSSNTQGDPSLAAAVAEAASLTELAGEILERAADLRPEERGALVGALSSFGIDAHELVALVTAVDVHHRPEAVRLLWQVAGWKALPALRTLLADTSGPVRVAVLDVLGQSGDPNAIEVANGVLESDSSPVVRAAAIRVIGRAGLEQRMTSLAGALHDPDPDVRATAVELLPQGMAGRAGELLLEAMTDEDDRVWQPAMRHLVSLPERDLAVLWRAIKQAPPERRDHLISLLERTSLERLGVVSLDHLTSADHDDRMLAISLAARSGTAQAIRGIIATLDDPRPEVRRAGTSALAELRGHEAVPALIEALNDPDAGVREGTLRTLSAIDDERVIDPLINALKDPEERVREMAIEALVRWSSPAVARRLVEALTSPVLRHPVGELLARMGTAAVDPLVNLLREGRPDIALVVGQTLEKLVGRDVFLSRLGSMDPAERLEAVEVLGAMGGLETVEGLTRVLSDPNEEIRIRALRALGDIGDRSAIDAVQRAAHTDPVPEVAAAAAEALRKLQA